MRRQSQLAILERPYSTGNSAWPLEHSLASRAWLCRLQERAQIGSERSAKVLAKSRASGRKALAKANKPAVPRPSLGFLASPRVSFDRGVHRSSRDNAAARTSSQPQRAAPLESILSSTSRGSSARLEYQRAAPLDAKNGRRDAAALDAARRAADARQERRSTAAEGRPHGRRRRRGLVRQRNPRTS